MNSLLDKRRRRNRRIVIVLLAFFAVLLIWGGNSLVIKGRQSGSAISRPFWKFGDWIAERRFDFHGYFSNKKTLENNIRDLDISLAQAKTKLIDRDILAAENNSLKAMLGRITNEHFILAPILARPPHSLYDTFIIDTKDTKSISVDDIVFADTEIPIGKVSLLTGDEATVTLFSTPGQTTEGILNIPGLSDGLSENEKNRSLIVELLGKGAGNFELRLPHDIVVPAGSVVTLPGLKPHVIALVGDTVSDPRDPFQSVLARSPVNIFELRWVQVKK